MKFQKCFILLLGLSGVLSTPLAGQHLITQNGVTLYYELQPDSIEIELFAPTQGWLAIGFNREDAIVGADLLQFAVTSEGLRAEDQFVRKPQVHPRDTEQNLRILSFREDQQGTMVRFKIPMRSGDPQDFEHQTHAPFFLILAYSAADDFQHHSRFRSHLAHQWLP
ncbi:MAG: hypothetical protein KDC44_07690 [Phaeodactylibacter sp.]|nr:hypothetical protein [Phaeodactylibacter sp.]